MNKNLGADLEELQANRLTLSASQGGLLQSETTQGVHEHVGGGGQIQPELIGAHRCRAGPVGEQTQLLFFYAVLHVAPRTVEVFVESAGSASRSATSGSPCRKPIPTARSSLPSFETSRPFLCAAEVCPDQTPPKTKSFHRSGRALPEYIPSRSSEPEKRFIHDHPHHRITRPGPDR